MGALCGALPLHPAKPFCKKVLDSKKLQIDLAFGSMGSVFYILG
jgi:hypothetical protein